MAGNVSQQQPRTTTASTSTSTSTSTTPHRHRRNLSSLSVRRIFNHVFPPKERSPMSTVAPTKSAAGGGTAAAELASKPTPLPAIIVDELKKRYAKLDASKIRGMQDDHKAPTGSFEEFLVYVASPNNSLVALPDPKKKDWSRPMNEYFISSSHNTYLVGHQLYGTSTTSGYANVLSRGCRCIEIDVWDGEDDEPEVFHGYTLTKEIKFKDVCKAIKKHAFSQTEGELYGGAGEGPVIISLEVHAGHEQQQKMVDIMEKEWGDSLMKGIEPEEVKALPSPLELRRKIVVKTKYAPDTPKTPVSEIPTPKRRDSSDTSSSSDSELEALSKAQNKKKPKKPKVIRSLARLGAYCSAYHFPGVTDTVQDPFLEHPISLIPNHVYSFSEKSFENYAEKRSREIFLHNMRHLMRVYPSGLRFSSSNVDPTPAWRSGAQMVALNWQRCDEGMMLNEAMFSGEGGYVVKPHGMKPGDGIMVEQKLDLTVEVIAASGIPLPEDDDKPKGFEPYVKIEVHTSNEDEEVKAKTKAKRGVDAVWNQKLEFRNVVNVVEKLCFVRFKIHDEEFGRDDLAAWACVRLDRMQEGFRLVKLFDRKGRQSEGLLLVLVKKTVTSVA